MDEIDIPQSVLSEYTDSSLTDIHHTLRAARRRLTIALLAYRAITDAVYTTKENRSASESQSDEIVVSVRQLAREIVAIEEDTSLKNSTGESYRNVYTALIQNHLEQLDKIGALEYDSDRKTVSPDKNLPALAMITVTTSSVAQLLFHRALVEVYNKKPVS